MTACDQPAVCEDHRLIGEAQDVIEVVQGDQPLRPLRGSTC
jgi:hypothetical protein